MIRVAVRRGVLCAVTCVSRSVASASEYDPPPIYRDVRTLHGCIRQMIRVHLSIYRAPGYCMCYPNGYLGVDGKMHPTSCVLGPNEHGDPIVPPKAKQPAGFNGHNVYGEL